MVYDPIFKPRQMDFPPLYEAERLKKAETSLKTFQTRFNRIVGTSKALREMSDEDLEDLFQTAQRAVKPFAEAGGETAG